MPLDINNIKYRDLYDKLRVFQLAGEDSDKGWDYAIPQGCFDELLKMGIEEPSRWFVADCTKGIFARLRHIGEAVFTILHARSEANKEISLAIHGDEIVSRVFHEFAGNAIFNEADCGLLDLNLAIGLVAEAHSRGMKQAREKIVPYQFGEQHRIHIKYLEEGVPREMISHCFSMTQALVGVEQKGVVIQSVVDLDAPPLVNEIIMESSTNPGDEWTAPHSITLRKWGEDQWVTHCRNHQAGGYSEGHYFFLKYAALTDYAKRCDAANVEAF